MKRAIYNVGYKNFHGEFLLERFNIENKNKMLEIDVVRMKQSEIVFCILYKAWRKRRNCVAKRINFARRTKCNIEFEIPLPSPQNCYQRCFNIGRGGGNKSRTKKKRIKYLKLMA